MNMNRRNVIRSGSVVLAATAMPSIGRAAARQIRLGHSNNRHSLAQCGAVAFAKAVSSLSDGRLYIDIFPNGTIGDEQQMLDAVADGTLDATVNNIGSAANFCKEISLVEMPYLFPDMAASRRAFDGALGHHSAELLKAKGIIVVGWGEFGLRHVTARKVIRVPADIVGLKLRVQLSEPTLQTFLAMGAAAETLPFTQLHEALRTGRLEAEENPFGVIIPSNFHLLQSHLSLTGHIYTPSVIVVSSDVMDDMTPFERDVLNKAGAAGAKAMRDFSDRMAIEGPGHLRALGMTIIEDVDRAAFKKAAERADESLAGTFGADALDRTRRLARS